MNLTGPDSEDYTEVHGLGRYKFCLVDRPILNDAESRRLEGILGYALPTICFGHNRCDIYLDDAGGDGPSHILRISAEELLKELSPLPVPYRIKSASVWRPTVPVCEPHTQYDWTFFSLGNGTINGENVCRIDMDEISLERLKLSATGQPDHECGWDAEARALMIDYHTLGEDSDILFYKHLDFYSDELSDNGHSESAMQLRVMSDGFYILLTSRLRIDHVVSKGRSVRIRGRFCERTLKREIVSGGRATLELWTY